MKHICEVCEAEFRDHEEARLHDELTKGFEGSLFNWRLFDGDNHRLFLAFDLRGVPDEYRGCFKKDENIRLFQACCLKRVNEVGDRGTKKRLRHLGKLPELREAEVVKLFEVLPEDFRKGLDYSQVNWFLDMNAAQPITKVELVLDQATELEVPLAMTKDGFIVLDIGNDLYGRDNNDVWYIGRDFPELD